MSVAFQPHIIRRDSNVPLRMMTIGWIIGAVVVIAVGPVDGRFRALAGLTLLTGGLIGATLYSSRTWRMVFGLTAGTVALWLGYRFAIEERLRPGLENEPLDLLDREHVAAILMGLAVGAIGTGGILEAIRAQSEPGHSPLPIRVLLIVVTTVIVAVFLNTIGADGLVVALFTAATAVSLATLAWIRRERPEFDFHPSP